MAVLAALDIQNEMEGKFKQIRHFLGVLLFSPCLEVVLVSILVTIANNAFFLSPPFTLLPNLSGAFLLCWLLKSMNASHPRMIVGVYTIPNMLMY